MKFDALVIGGGPAGSTAALLLARAGWKVAVVEKKIFPRDKVCGEFISATSLPLLDNLGIADFYLSTSGPQIQNVGLFVQNNLISAPMPQINNSFGKWGRALGREHLDLILLDAAVRNGAILWQPWKACKLERNSNSFSCEIQADNQIQTITSSVVILAHGSWEKGIFKSPIYKHKSTDFLAFKTHFQNSKLPTNLMGLMAFPGGYGGLVHSDSGQISFSCCIRRDYLQRARQQYPGLQAGEAVIQHIRKNSLSLDHIIEGSHRTGPWLSVGPIRPGIRRCYQDGIFYAGNLAGEAHPIIAEGISMAIQSASILSRLLIDYQNESSTESFLKEVGREYTRQWQVQFASRIHSATVFAQMAIRPQALACVLPIIKKFPAMLTYGAKLSGKVHELELFKSSG